MIRFAIADLVVVAAEVLGLDTAAVLDLLDLDAAEQALADPVPPVEDPADRAGALLHGLLQHRPLSRGNRRVAVLATAQFLALNGWQLDLEPAEDLGQLLRTADSPAALASWMRRHTCHTDTRQERRAMFGRTARTRNPFRRFTDRSRRVVVLAQEEARLHWHNYVGTEHLLLGLIHEGEGIAARTLRSFEVELEEVRRLVEEIIGRGREAPAGHIPLTPRAKRALDLALREALHLQQTSVATEHILLGLLREGDGVAAKVLVQLGLNLDQVRQRVLELAEENEPPDTTQLDELRRATDAAIDAGDFPRAAALRAQQRELLKATSDEENARLRREIEHLRALLRQAGVDPDEGTPRTA